MVFCYPIPPRPDEDPPPNKLPKGSLFPGPAPNGLFYAGAYPPRLFRFRGLLEAGAGFDIAANGSLLLLFEDAANIGSSSQPPKLFVAGGLLSPRDYPPKLILLRLLFEPPPPRLRLEPNASAKGSDDLFI